METESADRVGSKLAHVLHTNIFTTNEADSAKAEGKTRAVAGLNCHLFVLNLRKISLGNAESVQ